MIQERKSSYLS